MRSWLKSWMISIHALREEGDLGLIGIYAYRKSISIHALREEGDLQKASYWKNK